MGKSPPPARKGCEPGSRKKLAGAQAPARAQGVQSSQGIAAGPQKSQPGTGPGREGTDMSARGRWALVTGATGGVGEQFCRQLAGQGWSLVLHGRDADRLMVLAGELGRRGADVRTLVQDLSEQGGAQGLVGKVDALGIEPELVVNNAGFGYAAPFAESDAERQRALVALNVASLTELSLTYSERMAKAGHGAIVNVASVAGVMPGPYMATYYASKAYVLSLSQAMHEELRERGVEVLAVCPGPVRTGFWDVAGTNTQGRNAFMLSPEEVVRIALVALRHRRAVCAPGLVSKACYAFGRSMPGIVSRKVCAMFNRAK